jgi:hypothetical protein
MQSTALAAGDPIQARCTKCRKNTDHIVVTMADAAPVNVQCSVCSRQHKYRPATGNKQSAVGRTGKQNKDAELKEWEALRPTLNSAQATDYSMTAAYKVRALINHPVFGLGLVQRVIGPQKIAVLFADGKKTMRCK